MESALWNLEDKWKLSTQESIAFFICICSLVIGICIVTVFIRRRIANRRKGLVGQDPCSSSTDNDIEWSEPKLLSSSTLRWSGPSKWEEKRSRSHKERVSPLLVATGQLDQVESNGSEPKLLSTLRWSGPSKWEEKRSRSHEERVSPLLIAAGQLEGESNRWHSHNSDSPVWQRPILMGEKCELPRFSGLILYDERGRPVHHVDNDQFRVNQENVDVVGRTTLKDLLL